MVRRARLMTLARLAQRQGLVSDETHNAIEGLAVMRNLSAHNPSDDISTDRARDYLGAGRRRALSAADQAHPLTVRRPSRPAGRARNAGTGTAAQRPVRSPIDTSCVTTNPSAGYPKKVPLDHCWMPAEKSPPIRTVNMIAPSSFPAYRSEVLRSIRSMKCPSNKSGWPLVIRST